MSASATPSFSPTSRTASALVVPDWHNKIKSLTLTKADASVDDHTCTLRFTAELANESAPLTDEESRDLAQSLIFAHSNHPDRQSVRNGTDWTGLARNGDSLLRSKQQSGSLPARHPVHNKPLNPFAGKTVSLVNPKGSDSGAICFEGVASSFYSDEHDSDKTKTYTVHLKWAEAATDPAGFPNVVRGLVEEDSD